MRVKFRASESEFEPLANDSYTTRIESVEMKKSSTGNDMLVVVHTIVDPREGIGGRKIFDNLSLQVQAAWKLKNFLEAFEVPHAAMPLQEKGHFEIDFDTVDAINCQGVLKLEQETYQKRSNGAPVLDANGNAVMGVRNRIVEYLKG